MQLWGGRWPCGILLHPVIRPAPNVYFTYFCYRTLDDLVFSNTKGQPFREAKVLQRVLQPAAKDVGLGRLTWHQFRHIHSSLLNDLRVPAKIAQEQLGHASISTTRGIYTHVVDASHRSAVEAVEERLFVETVSNCLESAGALETVILASDSAN